MSGYLTNLVSRSNERGNILAPRLLSVFESEGVEVAAQSAESPGEIERTQPSFRKSPNVTSRQQLGEPEDDHQRVQRLELKNVTATSGEMNSPDDLRTFDSSSESDEPVHLVEKRTEVPTATSLPAQVKEQYIETYSPVSSQSQELPTSPMDRVPAQLQRKAIEQATISNTTGRWSNHAPVVEVTKEISRSGGDLAREVVGPEVDDQRSQPNVHRTSRKVGDKSIASERQLRASLPLDQLREQPIPAAARQAHEGVADNREPVINVTIGRIEVKATPASAQERRESRRSPVMPLDEYLKLQRRGGSR